MRRGTKNPIIRLMVPILLALLAFLAAAAVACDEEDLPGGTPPAAATPVPTTQGGLRIPTPTPPAPTGALNPVWFVPPPIEEQIYVSEAIVRASLVSATAGVAVIDSAPGVSPTYLPVQKLVFQVHEYLKGRGPAELLVVVRQVHTYLTEAEARWQAETSLAQRNTAWDDRDGVLFLREVYSIEEPGGSSGQRNAGTRGQTQEKTYGFTLSNPPPAQSHWDYSIDTLARAWLPAEETETQLRTTRNAGSPDSREYITDGSETPPPVLSLADLKAQISAVEARLRAGEGISGFDECIQLELLLKRHRLQVPYEPRQVSTTLDSGLPAGTEMERYQNRYREPEYFRFWLTGPGSDFFRSEIVDPDSDPVTGYDHVISTARPLGAGVYEFLTHGQPYSSIPCNFLRGPIAVWTVTVEAPVGTLHEAFFDPMADGAAVGYTAGAGGLEPASFAAGGTSVEITGLRWEPGSVSMTVSPPGALSDFNLKFIAVDGTTSRILQGGAATQDPGTGTITWQVSVPIWEDGDLVLLRIGEGGGDPSQAPGPTATPEPTLEPTPTATTEPTPTPS